MIKKTLYFGVPAYLSLSNNQLVIKLPEVEKSNMPENIKQKSVTTIPVEDIGIVVIDNKQITITSCAINALSENNCALIMCNDKSMPSSMLLPLETNTVQSERFREQTCASLPLKKQLWQQTVKAKIRNQAATLKRHTPEKAQNMTTWADSVKSGDTDNLEARAAAFYWKNIFSQHINDFSRNRDGEPPNNLLNYGYAILRAVIARSLVASGLLPTLGIHHHNRYNAYCLADDIMEPYRPYVDDMIIKIIKAGKPINQLDKSIKAELLTIPTIEVMINGKRSPLMIAAASTASSLYKCFSGESRKIAYPEM